MESNEIIDEGLVTRQAHDGAEMLAVVRQKSGRYGLISGAIGAFLALLIGLALVGPLKENIISEVYEFLFKDEIGQCISVFMVAILGLSFLIVREAGRLSINSRWPVGMGILAGILALVMSSLLAGLPLAFDPIWPGENGGISFSDIFFVSVLISAYGFIPAFITGIWVGIKLKRLRDDSSKLQ